MTSVQLERAISVEAGADLSTHQFKFVVLTSGRLAVSGDGADAIGVLSDKPALLGRPGRVVVGGVTKVIAGAGVNIDANVMSDGSGLAITAAGSGKYVLAKAMEAGVLNQVMKVLLMSSYPIESA